MRLHKALAISSFIAAILVASPFISAFAAAVIADAYGCNISVAVDEACIVAGSDVRHVLFNMVWQFGFFMVSLLYVPVAITLAVAAAVVWSRDRAGKYPIRNVGVFFWLLLFAALLLPLVTKFSLLLIVMAVGLYLWRRRKMAQRSRAKGRDIQKVIKPATEL